METPLDKKQEIDDNYRNEFINMINENLEPKRGKFVTIRKTKKRELSKDEIIDNLSNSIKTFQDTMKIIG